MSVTQKLCVSPNRTYRDLGSLLGLWYPISVILERPDRWNREFQ